MDLELDTLQSYISGDTLIKVGYCSQEDDTQFTENNDDAIDTAETTSAGVTESINNHTVTTDNVDVAETTSTGVIESINNHQVTTDNVTTTDAPRSPTQSNKLSIKKCSSYIYLAIVILFVITIVLTPIILYYTIPPHEGSFFDDVDFQSCSVSSYMNIPMHIHT